MNEGVQISLFKIYLKQFFWTDFPWSNEFSLCQSYVKQQSIDMSLGMKFSLIWSLSLQFHGLVCILSVQFWQRKLYLFLVFIGRVPYLEKCDSEHPANGDLAEEMWIGYRDYLALFFPGSLKSYLIITFIRSFLTKQIIPTKFIIIWCSLVDLVSKHALLHSFWSRRSNSYDSLFCMYNSRFKLGESSFYVSHDFVVARLMHFHLLDYQPMSSIVHNVQHK